MLTQEEIGSTILYMKKNELLLSVAHVPTSCKSEKRIREHRKLGWRMSTELEQDP